MRNFSSTQRLNEDDEKKGRSVLELDRCASGFGGKIHGWPRFPNKTSWQTSPSSGYVSMRPHRLSSPQARARWNEKPAERKGLKRSSTLFISQPEWRRHDLSLSDSHTPPPPSRRQISIIFFLPPLIPHPPTLSLSVYPRRNAKIRYRFEDNQIISTIIYLRLILYSVEWCNIEWLDSRINHSYSLRNW